MKDRRILNFIRCIKIYLEIIFKIYKDGIALDFLNDNMPTVMFWYMLKFVHAACCIYTWFLYLLWITSAYFLAYTNQKK